MACGCKKNNQAAQTTSTNKDVKIQEQQNKKIVKTIMEKLAVSSN